MDDAGHLKAQNSHSAYQERSSLDIGAPRFTRLQKQRSSAGLRSVSHGQPFSSAGQSITAMRGEGAYSGAGFGDGVRARKPSIRNAVRKIFGRRSRDVGPQSPDLSTLPPAPRHTYHRSEPSALGPTREELEPYMHNADFLDQTIPEPYQAMPSPNFNRTGSPYAVQFPNSVRLKPMDLGNPFIKPPSQLRRRKTLPSMAEGDTAAQPESQTAKSQAADMQPAIPNDAPQRTSSQTKKSRRKSRSTDDLKAANFGEESVPRKRSEEIRYWRESYQPDVLRASGFTINALAREDVNQSRRTTPQKKSPNAPRPDMSTATQDNTLTLPEAGLSALGTLSRSGTLRSSPPYQHGYGLSVGEGDFRPSSGAGTELSKDLEDRVAKLEAGLQTFQRSLLRLTAERNRRTVIMGGSIATRRSSDDMRTPSLLADTLADPLDPSSYNYEYGHTIRPTTSPRQPEPQADALPRSQPVQQNQSYLEDPFGPDLRKQRRVDDPTEPTADSFRIPSPLQSHPPTQQPPAPSTAAGAVPRTQPQPYTFSSLYQMLADERSARRKLEYQLRSLRQEISDLHVQVSSSSNMQSTRSSYMLAGSSSKLQELLRETENSPPASSRQAEQQRDSGMSAGTPAQMVSRFSGSESEGVALEYEELTTPYEAYQTPREERSKQSLAGAYREERLSYDDTDMF